MGAIVKRCACGLAYTMEEWQVLHFLGTMIVAEDDGLPAELTELRVCRCKSTIALVWVLAQEAAP